MMHRSTSRFHEEEEEEEEEEEDDYEYDSYVTYRPLSRLPTPPPSWKDSSLDICPAVDGQQLKPSLLGPATHLVNLIPVGASLTNPSVSLVQAMLTRADLPLETIALAVCILDSLNSRFALNWRLSCPLQPPTTPPPSSPISILTPTNAPILKRHTLTATATATAPTSSVPLHIDSVNPALIVLAALSIAIKFIDDPALPSSYFVAHFGHGLWTADQLNASERAIMINLNYRIMPLYKEDLLAEAMVDMQLAARPPPPPRRDMSSMSKKTASWPRTHGTSASMSVVPTGMAVHVLE